MIDSGCGFTLDIRGQLLCHSSTITIYPDGNVDPYYLLGVLNSDVFWEFIRHRTPTMGNGRHVYRINQVRRFPLVLPRENDDRRNTQRISELARELMVEGNNRYNCSDILLAIEQILYKAYGIGKSLT